MAKKRERPDDQASDDRSGLRKIMGELEAEVMECVWDLGSASVKDVHQRLLKHRELAYTTVMTAMSRMAAKGYLVCRTGGRAYIYEPTAGREAFCAGVVQDFMSDMLADADRRMLSNFVDSVTAEDESRLDLLSKIIEEKRRGRSSS